MWSWAFSYPAINILSTVYRKHHGNLEYCSNCSQRHGNHAISWGQHPNWKSVINHTTFKIKIMKSIFLVLWDILFSQLRTSTIYHTSEPQTLTTVQELWSLISQQTNTSILAAKNMSAYIHDEHLVQMKYQQEASNDEEISSEIKFKSFLIINAKLETAAQPKYMSS